MTNLTLDPRVDVFAPDSQATRTFRAHMARPVTGRVLDLGTGSGVLALEAAKTAYRVWGVDINPRAIRRARQSARHGQVRNARFLVGDWFEPMAGQQFDRVFCHVPFLPTAEAHGRLYADGGEQGWEAATHILAEAHRYLRPGGTLEMLGVWPEPPQAAQLHTTVYPLDHAPHGLYCFVRARQEA